MMFSAMRVFLGVLFILGCDVPSAAEREAGIVRAERSAYKETRKQMATYIHETNPTLPVVERCRVVAERWVPVTWRNEREARPERARIAGMCEAILAKEE